MPTDIGWHGQVPGLGPNVFTTLTETTPIEARGTVTLLPGGRFILGCPQNCTDEERAVAKDALIRFVEDSTRGEALPFPVDVVDLRLRG